MPRRRMIDPLIWEDEHFARLSDKARILFIACFSNADDDGRLIGALSHLRAIAFRYDDLSLKKIEALVAELKTHLKHFSYYHVNGCSYIQLGKWEEYQTQRDDRRKPSRLPDVSQASDKCQTNVGVSKDKLSKDKVREDKGQSCKQDATLPILYLNKKAKTHFKPDLPTNQAYVKARYAEGRTLGDFQKVIDLKCGQWLSDSKMAQYLRPKTLFNASNFESYLNEPEVQDGRNNLGIFRSTET